MEDQKIIKQKYCYILKLYPKYYDFDNWPEEATKIVGTHFNYLKKLTEEGVVIMAGRTVNNPMTENDFGIIILEASSKEEAQNIMDNDPSIKGKVMYATLYDFSLALSRK